RGMRSVAELTVQVGLCVRCHVGNAGQEVDHDLIAAGHPRLNFEYGTYLAAMPRHWSGQMEKVRYPDFEARAWAVGQALSAHASLELLAHRAVRRGAGSAGSAKAWPEFSEYDCFSCHHSLLAGSWRQKRYLDPQSKEGPKQGLFRWNPWYTALLPQVLASANPQDQQKTLTSLETLRRAMRMANPDRELVARLARETAAGLGAWAEQRARGDAMDLAAVHQLVVRIARDGE